MHADSTLPDLIRAAKEFERAGRWDDALACYERTLSHLPHYGTASDAADVLRWIGTVHRERGELELAAEVYEVSLAVAELNSLERQIASALNCLGAIEHQRGQIEAAEDLYSRALARAVALEDDRLAAMLDQNLGTLRSQRGDLHGALASYASALERSHRTGDDLNSSRALNNMALTHRILGNWDDAELLLNRALALADVAGDRLLKGMLDLNQGELQLKRGRPESARAACERSLHTFNQLRSRHWIAEAYKFSGILHREAGDAERADACFAMALGLAEVAQNLLLQAEAQMEWAIVHLQAGRCREGILYLNQALHLFTQMRARREVVDIRERLQKVESLYLPAVQQWSTNLFSSAEPDRAEHAARVAALGCAIGVELGLSGWDLMVLRVGALLHDIGHSIYEEAAAEAEPIPSHHLVRAHTIVGDALADRLNFPAEVRSIIRSHHERMDGNGFPDRLKGPALSLPVRIVAVADRFDRVLHSQAIASRTQVDTATALGELRRRAGSHIDREVLSVLHRVLSDGFSIPGAA